MTSPYLADPALADLGNDLEAAAGRHLAGSRRRARRRMVALAAVAFAALSAGGAVAAGLFTPRQVAASLPASAVIFDGVHPTCALDVDGVTFHCTLDVAPGDDAGIVDLSGLPPEKRAASEAAAAQDPAAFLGRLEPIAIDGVVAGGCVGRTTDGLSWDCYTGTEAVDRGIIGPDFLGQPMEGPGRG